MNATTVIPLFPATEAAPPKALPPTSYVPASSHGDASEFRKRMARYVKLYGPASAPSEKRK